MSEQDISNDPTPEALAAAEQAAKAAPDTLEAGGEGASPSSNAAPSSEGGFDTPDASASSKKDSPNMGGDLASDALMQMSTSGQTLAKKKATLGTGLATKSASAASFIGTSALTGGLTISGFQVAATILNAVSDRYRVRETGQAMDARDWVKAKGNPRTKAQIMEGKEPLKYKGVSMRATHGRGAPKSQAERALGLNGRKGASPNSDTQRRKRLDASATLQSNGAPSPYTNSAKAAMQARLRNITEVGLTGVQKDAKLAPKALDGYAPRQKGIREETLKTWKYTAVVRELRPSHVSAPKSPGA